MATSNLNGEIELGHIGALSVIERGWGRMRMVCLGYPDRSALVMLPLDDLLKARPLAADDAADDDDVTLLWLIQSAKEALVMTPMKGYQFACECMAGGYDPKIHSYHLIPWLVGQLQVMARVGHPRVYGLPQSPQ